MSRPASSTTRPSSSTCISHSYEGKPVRRRVADGYWNGDDIYGIVADMTLNEALRIISLQLRLSQVARYFSKREEEIMTADGWVHPVFAAFLACGRARHNKFAVLILNWSRTMPEPAPAEPEPKYYCRVRIECKKVIEWISE